MASILLTGAIRLLPFRVTQKLLTFWKNASALFAAELPFAFYFSCFANCIEFQRYSLIHNSVKNSNALKIVHVSANAIEVVPASKEDVSWRCRMK
jgi:hypothetical protein